MASICITEDSQIHLLSCIHGMESISIVADLPILPIYYIPGMVNIYTKGVLPIPLTSYIHGMESTSIKVDSPIRQISYILLMVIIFIEADSLILQIYY